MACQITGSPAKPKAQKASSDIINVDFFEETIIFANMNVLVQSGVFALTQAHTLPTNALNLLQEGAKSN